MKKKLLIGAICIGLGLAYGIRGGPLYIALMAAIVVYLILLTLFLRTRAAHATPQPDRAAQLAAVGSESAFKLMAVFGLMPIMLLVQDEQLRQQLLGVLVFFMGAGIVWWGLDERYGWRRAVMGEPPAP